MGAVFRICLVTGLADINNLDTDDSVVMLVCVSTSEISWSWTSLNALFYYK